MSVGDRVQKVRHAIKPEVTYNYIPSAGPSLRPDFVLPVGNTTVGGVAANVDAENSITYALTNTLMSRLRDDKGNVSYREVFRLKLSQTYNITTPTIYRDSPVLDDSADAPTRCRRIRQNPSDLSISRLTSIRYKYLGFMTRTSYDVNTTSWAQINQDIALERHPGRQPVFRLPLHEEFRRVGWHLRESPGHEFARSLRGVPPRRVQQLEPGEDHRL